MSQTPSPNTRYKLRSEVYFGCPVQNCGSPYLTYHHFDPPYRVKPHHNQAGIIALCWHHHHLADREAFSPAQLRQLKVDPFLAGRKVRWKFDVWDRRRLILFAGGNWHVGCSHILSVRGHTLVGLSQAAPAEPGGLNLDVRDGAGKPVLSMDGNAWNLDVVPDDLECSPHGNSLRVVHHATGIQLKVGFHSLDPDALDRLLRMRMPLVIREDLFASISSEGLEWPVAVATLSGVIRWPISVALGEHQTVARGQFYSGNVLSGGITL
jgi:hypothetical protein